MAIKNRYEFIYYVACTNANPNGDPDMGNTPRVDPQTMQGYISDVSTKRLIRNYVTMSRAGEPGMEIIVQKSTNMNRHIARAKREAGVEDCAKAKEAIYAGRQKACELFYDVRTFGAVMSTGPNAGQVRGPVQITFGKSFLGFAISLALMLGEAMILHHFDLQRHDSMYVFLLPCMYFLFIVILHFKGKRLVSLRTASLIIYIIHPMMIVVIRLFSKLLHIQKLFVENSIVHYFAVCLTSVVFSVVLTTMWNKLSLIHI